MMSRRTLLAGVPAVLSVAAAPTRGAAQEARVPRRVASITTRLSATCVTVAGGLEVVAFNATAMQQMPPLLQP